MKNNNLDDVKKEIVPILKKHDVSRASIFGSFAHGGQRNDSDLDN